jgi:uncharacterized RDD family membrane protein YckC
MKTAVLSLAAVILLCATALAASKPRDLLAHGGDKQFWIARVIPASANDPFESTNIFYREDFGGPWTPLRNISSRVMSLASHAGEMLVVLKDGQWMIGDEEDIRLGPPPPNDGKMIAIASEQATVWAVVTDEGPTTRTSTSPAATTLAAPIPAITVPVHRRFVYQFQNGQWINPKPLPAELTDQNFDSLSMAVVNDLPVLAWLGSGRKIEISRMNAGGTWKSPVEVAPPAGSQDFKLLSAEGHAVLWTSAPSNAPPNAMGGQLHEEDDFSRVITLPLTPPLPPAGQLQTFALFKERWRWIDNPDKEFYEQDYEMDGKVAPDYVPGSPDDQTEEKIPLAPYVGGAAVVVVIAAIAAISQRRTRGIPPPVPKDLILDRVAPLGVRSAAAIIDLIPTLATLWAFPHSFYEKPTQQDIINFEAVALVGLAAYVAHTLVSELICQQSVGKMVFGLRVAGSFGGKPSIMGIIVRNLLRPADLFPLVSFTAIILSPRWQRVGDLIGRTIVITDEPQEPEDEKG